METSMPQANQNVLGSEVDKLLNGSSFYSLFLESKSYNLRARENEKFSLFARQHGFRPWKPEVESWFVTFSWLTWLKLDYFIVFPNRELIENRELNILFWPTDMTTHPAIRAFRLLSLFASCTVRKDSGSARRVIDRVAWSTEGGVNFVITS